MYAKALTYKSYSILIYLIKISIIAFSFYFIYSKLAYNNALSFSKFWSVLNSDNILSLKSLLGITLLSCLNWFFEILKWKYLVSTFKPMSLKRATEQTLGAHTASLFTPNRIGDYGAKALYFSAALRPKIVGLNGVGNLAQMGVTTFFGSIGLLFFISKHSLNIDIHTWHWANYFIAGCIGIIFILLVKRYLKPESWVLNVKRFLRGISKDTFIKTLLFSTLRYVIFSFQFYVFLQLFQVDLSYLNTMMILSSMYLLASILPSIFIFDVVLKGSIAVYLFSFFGINSTVVLSCISLMWIFNVVLPSFFGSYFVMSFKLPKS